MFEMIIYILHFSLSRNNRSLQKFQSTCRQGITWSFYWRSYYHYYQHAFFFFVTNIVDDSEWQKICIVLRLNVGKKKTRNIEVFSQLSNFQSFNSENENAFSKKSQRSFVL